MKNDLKQRILWESAQLMLAYGVKVMTMDELAKRIGVSKRTIYENFQDKDALITAILRYIRKKGEAANKTILRESPTVIHAIFHFQNSEESVCFSQLIARHDELKRYHPKVYEKEIRTHSMEQAELTKNLFRLGVEQNVFRKDLDVDVAASLLTASFQSLWEDKVGLRQYYPLEKMYEVYLRIFVRGCCSMEGLKIFEEVVNNGKKVKE